MPVAFIPEAKTKFCLKADEDRPIEQRVYFSARFLTSRQLDEMFTILEEADALLALPAEQKKGRDIHAERQVLRRKATAIGILGPVDAKHPQSGEPIPCTIDGIEQVLSYSEMWQLLYDFPRAISLSEADQKKSDSATPASSPESAKAGA